MEAGKVGHHVRYFAGWADKIHGKLIDTQFDTLCYTRHEPFGVVGIITPWNAPIFLTIINFSPALAAGNTGNWSQDKSSRNMIFNSFFV